MKFKIILIMIVSLPLTTLANISCYQGSGLCKADAGQTITAGNPPPDAGMGPATDANLVWLYSKTPIKITKGQVYQCVVTNINGYGPFTVGSGTYGDVNGMQITQAGTIIKVTATQDSESINALGFIVDATHATGPAWLSQGPQADFVCR